MALRRYARDTVLGFGSHYGSPRAIESIRAGIASGAVRFKAATLGEGDRIDIVAGREYGDASLWWVICSASEIGYMLQCPPGTALKIPLLSDVTKLIG